MVSSRSQGSGKPRGQPAHAGAGSDIQDVAWRFLKHEFMKSARFSSRSRVAAAALVIFLLSLGGCANNPQSEVIRNAVAEIRSPGSLLRTPAEIAAYPYAQMSMKLSGYLPAIAVLAEYLDGDHYWYVAEDLWLRQSPDGRIKGMQVAEKRTLVRWDDVSLQPVQPDAYLLSVTRVDGAEESGSIAVQCSLAESVAASIIVNEATIDTTRSRYDCHSDGAAESFSMTYWHDAAGRIRRTEGRLWQNGLGYSFEALKVPA